MHLHVKGETLAFSGPWTLQSSGNISITGTTCTITAPTITLAGNVEITGTLKVDGYATLAQGGIAQPHITNSDGSGGGS